MDPYSAWLGISPDRRPPSHYVLLGVSPSASVAEIESAAAERLNLVRRYQVGRFAADAIRLSGEIANAFAILRDAAARRSYDESLANDTPRFELSPRAYDYAGMPPVRIESTWRPPPVLRSAPAPPATNLHSTRDALWILSILGSFLCCFPLCLVLALTHPSWTSTTKAIWAVALVACWLALTAANSSTPGRW